ncbi:PH domain-containing protein [Actinospica durhamensis]|uniref:PH domain-containing protein n=1 Tax=Actinospica durhamensis TaxID=1508375 RepID=A0A941EX09_9ACTN|nr:PH domain-containing protein [Actinospica durhamensis]
MDELSFRYPLRVRLGRMAIASWALAVLVVEVTGWGGARRNPVATAVFILVCGKLTWAAASAARGRTTITATGLEIRGGLGGVSGALVWSEIRGVRIVTSGPAQWEHRAVRATLTDGRAFRLPALRTRNQPKPGRLYAAFYSLVGHDALLGDAEFDRAFEEVARRRDQHGPAVD